MPESKRKKKLEKTANTDSATYTKTYCCRCGMAYTRKKGFFSASRSPMYRGSGYLTVCNTCVDDMYDALAHKIGPKEAMRRMCMKLDIYWSDDIYEVMERTTGENSRVRNYIAKTNLVKYLNKNFDDTIAEESEKGESALTISSLQDEVVFPGEAFHGETATEEEPIDPEIVEFWGSDFSTDFIRKLDKRYKGWTDEFEDLDKGSIALYKQICILEETINREAAEGKPVDKYMNTLNTMLGSANLKPAQKKTEVDIAMESTPFGVWIDRWEKKRPVPDPDPAFQDVDGIIKYITVWFYGHISHTLGLNNIYCKMYEEEIENMKIRRPDKANEIDDESIRDKIFKKPGSDAD